MLNVDQMAEMVSSIAKRLNVTDNELLTDLLKEAEIQVLDYTGQKKLIGSMSIYVKKLAIINYNRLGLEGETQRSEGGVTNYLEIGIPKDIRQGLNHYRIAKVTRL
ncbi:phage head-tail connector protein [Limosilactobacillus sp. STM2_1]|uniref:Phage head-tail connector protein n=2 Tax=Limosilactobacillus rudii TaxID=2759755 RepID=A0A7W3UJR3_9LACO|nr:phage head-tail connector protein [Limosilactobacillus rudii]MBB1080245.1 phage head-tail connector protein [Limosilactobacillus rudii]MBB1096851.1 phage head-tail connector protein [Limosilactobacillus rudii]MCD7133749.1 phage head-tail connector protein [Limosilactobacillus rudii]